MTSKLPLVFSAVLFASMLAAGSSRDPAAGEVAGRGSETALLSQEGPPPVTGDTVTTASGLKYIVIIGGDGPAAERGRSVVVHYSGWLLDGTLFDSSVLRGDPFEFELGAGRVIPGWDEGVALMQVGDKWRFIIPPELGYGERGYPGAIPSNATLIFDVALLEVK